MARGEFGWGGTSVRNQHRCPEVRLNGDRNLVLERQGKCCIDAVIFSTDWRLERGA